MSGLGARYEIFINQTLIKCKELKDRYNNIIYNISLLSGFVAVIDYFYIIT